MTPEVRVEKLPVGIGMVPDNGPSDTGGQADGPNEEEVIYNNKSIIFLIKKSYTLTVESNKLVSSTKNPVNAGPSTCKSDRQVKEQSQLPSFANKLLYQVTNLRDIKNVTPISQLKHVKNTAKTKVLKKVCKKPKIDNQSSGSSGQALITSYFGHSNEKNIRL